MNRQVKVTLLYRLFYYSKLKIKTLSVLNNSSKNMVIIVFTCLRVHSNLNAGSVAI